MSGMQQDQSSNNTPNRPWPPVIPPQHWPGNLPPHALSPAPLTPANIPQTDYDRSTPGSASSPQANRSDENAGPSRPSRYRNAPGASRPPRPGALRGIPLNQQVHGNLGAQMNPNDDATSREGARQAAHAISQYVPPHGHPIPGGPRLSRPPQFKSIQGHRPVPGLSAGMPPQTTSRPSQDHIAAIPPVILPRLLPMHQSPNSSQSNVPFHGHQLSGQNQALQAARQQAQLRGVFPQAQIARNQQLLIAYQQAQQSPQRYAFSTMPHHSHQVAGLHPQQPTHYVPNYMLGYYPQYASQSGAQQHLQQVPQQAPQQMPYQFPFHFVQQGPQHFPQHTSQHTPQPPIIGQSLQQPVAGQAGPVGSVQPPIDRGRTSTRRPRLPPFKAEERTVESPVIDISFLSQEDDPEYNERVKQIGLDLRQICEKWGYFHITGHGINVEFMKHWLGGLSTWFANLLPGDKVGLHRKCWRNMVGYEYPSDPIWYHSARLPGTESFTISTGKGDERTTFTGSNPPPDGEWFRRCSAEWQETMRDLAWRVLQLIAESLLWDSQNFYDDCWREDAYYYTSMHHYFPHYGDEEADVDPVKTSALPSSEKAGSSNAPQPADAEPEPSVTGFLRLILSEEGVVHP